MALINEHAVDSGGVARDMFSGFWLAAFQKFFDGSGSLVPATHPNVDMSVFPVLGTILSHIASVSSSSSVIFCDCSSVAGI